MQKSDQFKFYGTSAYFDKDKPLVSDKDYDILKEEILDLEKKYKYLNKSKSPSQEVGHKPSNKFRKIDHQIPMLSLGNAFSRENIHDFIKKLLIF